MAIGSRLPRQSLTSKTAVVAPTSARCSKAAPVGSRHDAILRALYDRLRAYRKSPKEALGRSHAQAAWAPDRQGNRWPRSSDPEAPGHFGAGNAARGVERSYSAGRRDLTSSSLGMTEAPST